MISLALFLVWLILNIGFAVFLVSRLRSNRLIETLAPKMDNNLFPGINSRQLMKFRKRLFFWMIVSFSICGFNLALLAVYSIVIAFSSK